MKHPLLVEIKRRYIALAGSTNATITPSRAAERTATCVVEALLAAWLVCGWKIRLRNSSAINLLVTTYTRAYQRPHECVKDLKGSLHSAREQSLTGFHIGRNTKGKVYPRSMTPTRNQLFQISCASRSLPQPPDPVVEKELAEWTKGVTTEPPPFKRKWIRREAEVFESFFKDSRNMRIIRKFKKRYVDSPKTVSPFGGSACLGYTKKDGGRSAHFRDLVYTEKGKRAPTVNQVPYSISYLRNWKKRYLPDYHAKALRALLISPAVPVAVKERGYKVRVVTKNDPYRVARAHAVRRVLYPLVTKNPRTVLSDLPKVIPIRRDNQRRKVISLDLKKATDTIRHPFLAKLCEALGVDPKLIYRGFRIGPKLVKIGAFMGMPVSWTILEWTHDFACRSVDPLGNFVHKGDDALMYWTQAQFWAYLKIMKVFGYILNEVKTFHSPDRGTFCEGLYILEGDNLMLQPVISLRSLVVTGVADKIEVMGSASREALRRGFDPKLFNRVLPVFFSHELKMIRKLGVPMYLPVGLGGAGLVPDDPEAPMSNFDCAQFWGGLDKDLPSIPRFIAEKGGKHLTALASRLSRLEYRSGVQPADVCPHLDDWIRLYYQKSSVHDSEEKRKRKLLGFMKTLKAILRVKRKITPAFRSKVSWRFVNSMKLQPTPSSVQEVYPHECDGTPPASQKSESRLLSERR